MFFLLQSCEICQEPFETYWVEEEEDWFLKNAVRVDDKVRHTTSRTALKCGNIPNIFYSWDHFKNMHILTKLFFFSSDCFSSQQNFHPACFEDYKNVSHLELKYIKMSNPFSFTC